MIENIWFSRFLTINPLRSTNTEWLHQWHRKSRPSTPAPPSRSSRKRRWRYSYSTAWSSPIIHNNRANLTLDIHGRCWSSFLAGRCFLSPRSHPCSHTMSIDHHYTADFINAPFLPDNTILTKHTIDLRMSAWRRISAIYCSPIEITIRTKFSKNSIGQRKLQYILHPPFSNIRFCSISKRYRSTRPELREKYRIVLIHILLWFQDRSKVLSDQASVNRWDVFFGYNGNQSCCGERVFLLKQSKEEKIFQKFIESWKIWIHYENFWNNREFRKLVSFCFFYHN